MATARLQPKRGRAGGRTGVNSDIGDVVVRGDVGNVRKRHNVNVMRARIRQAELAITTLCIARSLARRHHAVKCRHLSSSSTMRIRFSIRIPRALISLQLRLQLLLRSCP